MARIMECLAKVGKASHEAIIATQELDAEVKRAEDELADQDQKLAELDKLSDKVATLTTERDGLQSEIANLGATKSGLQTDIAAIFNKYKKG